MARRELVITWDSGYSLVQLADAVARCRSLPVLVPRDSGYWGPYFLAENEQVHLRLYSNWDPIDAEAVEPAVAANAPLAVISGNASQVAQLCSELSAAVGVFRVVKER